MTVQIVEIAGQKMAMLPVADYERLLDLAEDRTDVQAAVRAEERREAGEEYIPFEMVGQIMGGESALRVWRKHRGLTQAELCEATGLKQSMLSHLEKGVRQGKPTIWRKLAVALNVDVDDILPVDVHAA